MKKKRPYQSRLRKSQAELTRERLLLAARDFLERGGDIEQLTLRQLATLAGVSAPTVYAHFPTMDDLVRAFFFWLKPRLALDQPLPDLAALPGLPASLFARYEEHGALLRSLMHQPSWDRQRQADRAGRQSPWIDAIGHQMPHLSPVQRRRGALVLSAFWSPTLWRWMRDTCGFTPAESALAARWAIECLTRDLEENARALTGKPSRPPAKKTTRKK